MGAGGDGRRRRRSWLCRIMVSAPWMSKPRPCACGAVVMLLEPVNSDPLAGAAKWLPVGRGWNGTSSGW